MKRDSFIFYRSFFEAIQNLSIEEQGLIFSAICDYSLNKKAPKFSGGVCSTVWLLIKPQLDANLKRFENGSKPKALKVVSKPEAKPKQKASKPEANNNVNNNKNVNVLFDLFWSKYPTKVSKQKTKSLFLKLTDTEVQTILNTIDSFVKHKPFPEYTHPHPTTYLNQKRWQDEIPLPDQTKPQISRDVWFIARQIPAQKQKLCDHYSLTEQQFDTLYQ